MYPPDKALKPKNATERMVVQLINKLYNHNFEAEEVVKGYLKLCATENRRIEAEKGWRTLVLTGAAFLALAFLEGACALDYMTMADPVVYVSRVAMLFLLIEAVSHYYQWQRNRVRDNGVTIHVFED